MDPDNVGGRHWFRRLVRVDPFKQRGLGILDLQKIHTALLAKWMVRFLSS